MIEALALVVNLEGLKRLERALMEARADLVDQSEMMFLRRDVLDSQPTELSTRSLR